MKILERNWLAVSAIILFGLLLFLPFLGSVHLFDWDEINFAESAREMILTGDYLNVRINYQPFWEKPPLFIWMQVLSMKVFGVNEFAARFPNALCGILTLLALYAIGKKIYTPRFGMIWVLSYAAAILPFFYFKSGIIDPWFNLLIFSGVTFFVFYLEGEKGSRRTLHLTGSAFFLGLAVLTKGPVAFLVFLISFMVFLVFRKFRIRTSLTDVLLFTLVLALTGGSWFILQLATGHQDVVLDFIRYQVRLLTTSDSGHAGFFMYHFVIVLLGVFPASILFLTSFTRKAESNETQKSFKRWMYIMFWVVLLLFSVVKTKIIHYSLLTYFPMTFLAAWVWDKWIDRKIELRNWQIGIIFFIALIYATMTIAGPLLVRNPDWVISHYGKFLNLFRQQALMADVHWTGYEVLPGIFLLLGTIVSLVLVVRRDVRGMVLLHVVSLVFVFSTISLIAPRVEQYGQGAVIEFYKELKGQDVYVNTLGFKSYAQLFYFDKQPVRPEADDLEWLMSPERDKEAFFVIKAHLKEEYLQKYPQLTVLYEKNGFVFTRLDKEGEND